jgi:sulfate adenylyltransferase subunit 2
MDHLSELESKSIYIIREAYHKYNNIAMLWSIGKDSTTLLWLCRKAFFGRVPFPVIHIDTSFKFPDMYKFRDEKAKLWNLKLIIGKNEATLKRGVGPEKGKFECCTALKTEALKQVIDKHGFKALLLGIRRDEHGIRAKERYFSPRNQEFKWDYKNQGAEMWDQYKEKLKEEEHVRVHPLLHWREIDIWSYIKRENIPITRLYFSNNGRRYRSIGCVPCCSPVVSEAKNIDEVIEELKTTKEAERSGRAQDKEKAYMMQKLRAMGYM